MIEKIIENEIINKNIKDIDIFKIISLYLENKNKNIDDNLLIKTLKNYDTSNKDKKIKLKEYVNNYFNPPLRTQYIIIEQQDPNNENPEGINIRYDDSLKKSITFSSSMLSEDKKTELHQSITISEEANKLSDFGVLVSVFKNDEENKYGNQGEVLEYRYDHDFLKKESLENIEYVNGTFYEDIGEELMTKKTIDKDFFEVLLLKYDYKEKDVTNFILKIFNENKIMQKTIDLISILDKKNKNLNKIKQGN